jgi:hypothetical protein
MATIRAYLEDVYPMGSLGPGGSATDAEASGLFRSRHWYYAGAPGLVRDPHRLARIDRAVGREHMESWQPRGQPHRHRPNRPNLP